jgi:hypothetical protein
MTRVVTAGGTVLTEPVQMPVGRLAVVTDAFGNALILLDLSAGHYATDATGRVTGLTPKGAIAHPAASDRRTRCRSLTRDPQAAVRMADHNGCGFKLASSGIAWPRSRTLLPNA